MRGVTLSERVVIVAGTGIGFPDGFAATQRIRNYADMLLLLGYDVEVLCADPSCRDQRECPGILSSGVSGGVPFRYAGGSAIRASNFFVRRWRSAASWVRIVSHVLSVRPALVLTYPMSTPVASLLVPATRISASALLADQSELPAVHAGPGFRGRIRLWWRWRGLRASAGVIAITTAIRDDLSSRLPSDHILLMPVVIDAQELKAAPGARSNPTQTIVYTGKLNDSKDGVGSLLEAFATVRGQRPSARLILAGESDPVLIEEFSARVTRLGVADAVTFAGRLSRDELRATTGGAAVLVLPRPDTPQNRANMPTKLIEYLATGRPVVATAVGTVSEVLTDGEDAFVVPPSDPVALACAIESALSDPARSAAIAARGRELAISRWDYRIHAEHLQEFLTSVGVRPARPAPVGSGQDAPDAAGDSVE